MLKNLKKLFALLNYQEKTRVILLLIMITIVNLFEVVGITSIYPLLKIISDPTAIETNNYLNAIYQKSVELGINNKDQFIFFFGIGVLVIILSSIIFKSITVYTQIRFTKMREYSIGKTIFAGYLRHPYSWFISNHSSDLTKNILSEVANIIGNALGPMIELFSRGITTFFIISMLLIINTKTTFIISLFFILFYLLTFSFIKNYLKKYGEIAFRNNKLRYLTVNEAFNAIKEIKLLSVEQIFSLKFNEHAKIYSEVQSLSQYLGLFPRYIIELITFGGFTIFLLFIISSNYNFINIIPIISLYVFAAYRLLPSIQQLYSCFASLTFAGPAIDKIYGEFNKFQPIEKDQDKKKFLLNDKIKLKNINFSYSDSSRLTLKNVSLEIPSKSKVGIIGTTGSGKTTLVDIILGLLRSQEGSIEVDGKIISNDNLKSWQELIGYVPQQIYLSDDTIVSNIAFGISEEKINQSDVEQAAKIANIHNFIIDELPNKYLSKIGERGVKLSGGQRQRIGIARALYRKPKLLVLDEATSALDNETEQMVIESLNKDCGDMTVILIAHRLESLRKCDIILKLNKGKIEKIGKFKDIFII